MSCKDGEPCCSRELETVKQDLASALELSKNLKEEHGVYVLKIVKLTLALEMAKNFIQTVKQSEDNMSESAEKVIETIGKILKGEVSL